MTKAITQPKSTLTKKQAQLYDALVKLIKKNKGACPTYRELAQECGYKSHSIIARLIYGLEERGYIKRDKTKKTSITVL